MIKSRRDKFQCRFMSKIQIRCFQSGLGCMPAAMAMGQAAALAINNGEILAKNNTAELRDVFCNSGAII